MIHDNNAEIDTPSSDSSLTRSEFLRRAVKGTVIAGGALVGPKVLDRFLVPPAYAANSVCAFFTNGQLTTSGTGSGGPTFPADANGDIYILNGTTGGNADVNQVTCLLPGPGGSDTSIVDENACTSAAAQTSITGRDVFCSLQ